MFLKIETEKWLASQKDACCCDCERRERADLHMVSTRKSHLVFGFVSDLICYEHNYPIISLSSATACNLERNKVHIYLLML